MSAAPLPLDVPAPDWLTGITRQRSSAAPAAPARGDTAAAARLLRLQREEAALDQYRDNIDVLTERLHREESRLDTIASDLLEARRLIGRTCTGGVAMADFDGAASALKSLRERLGRAAATSSPGPAEPAGMAGAGEHAGELWVAAGLAHRVDAAAPDVGGVIGALVDAIVLFDQPDRERDDVAWRVEIDRTLLDLDAGFDCLNSRLAAIVNARNLLQTLSDNHTNVSLSNKHLAMSLGQIDDAGAALLLQGHEVALHASQTAQAALGELSLFDAA